MKLVQHSKETVEWYTPSEIIESSRMLMGDFDLDPASNVVANGRVRARSIFTEQDEGLQRSWMGRIFVNPPGGDSPKGSTTRSNAALWWTKLAYEYQMGHTHQAVFVGFSIEVLQQTQLLVCIQPTDFPLCIPRTRMKFVDHRTLVPARMPAHANVIVYLPPKNDFTRASDMFKQEFSKYGKVLNA